MNITVPDLPGARLVDTPACKRIATSAGFVVPDGQVCLIHGPVGTGKATALRRYLATQDLPVTWIDLPATFSTKELISWLYDDVAGYPDDLPVRDLQDDLVRALAQQQRIVVVRYADRLTKEAAGQLQWLHDRPGASWSLFLVGSPGTPETVQRDALLRGCIAQTVQVTPLRGRDLLTALGGIHPLLLGAGSELLTEIDAQVCHGLLSHWARFLHVALTVSARAVAAGHDAPVLDRKLAKATLSLMPTTMTEATKKAHR